jgi:hypothetical protein
MALSGYFIDLNAMGTFLVAGVLMTLLVLIAALNPAVRTMDYDPV